MPEPVVTNVYEDQHTSKKGPQSSYSRRSGRNNLMTDYADVAQINKLFYAIDEKVQRQGLSSVVEGSLRSQMFGVFAENYKKWMER